MPLIDCPGSCTLCCLRHRPPPLLTLAPRPAVPLLRPPSAPQPLFCVPAPSALLTTTRCSAVPAPTAPLTLCSARPLLCSPTALFTQCSAYPLLTLAAVAECWLLGGWVVLAGWQQWLAVGLAGYAKPPGWLAGCSPVPLPVAGCPPAGYFTYLTSYTVMYLYLS